MKNNGGHFKFGLIGKGGMFRNIDRTILLYFLVWFAVNVPLLLVFYDYFNLNGIIQSTSNLVIGLNPYKLDSVIISGIYLEPYYLLIYFFYSITHFNIYFTVILIKITSIFFTGMTGILLYKMVILVKKDMAKRVLILFLFNPFIMFINDVWVQPESLIIFFIALAIYIFQFKEESLSFPRKLAGAFSLIFITFSYYFPIFFIPSFLIFSRNRKRSFSLLIILILAALPSFVFIIVYHLSSSYVSTNTSSLVSLPPSIYSIFSLFTLSSSVMSTIETLILIGLTMCSFIIPLIAKKMKFEITTSLLLISIAIFIFYSESLNADDYVILIPLFLIELFVVTTKNIGIKFYIFQIPILIELILAQIYNGPGYATGIFYWIYPFIHKNIVLSTYIPNLTLWHDLAVIGIVVSLGFTFVYILLTKHSNSNLRMPLTPGNEFNSLENTPKKRYIIVFFLVALILLTAMPLVHETNNTSDITACETFPQLLFMPSVSSSDLFHQPSPCYFQYFKSNNTLNMHNLINESIQLTRNLTSQDFTMTGNYSINISKTNVGYFQSAFGLGNISVGDSNSLYLQNGLNYIRPNSVSNITKGANLSGWLGPSIYYNNSISTNEFNNTSYLVYNFTYAQLKGNSLVSSFNLKRNAKSQNILWRLKYNNITLEAFIVDGTLYSGYKLENKWHLSRKVTDIKCNEWIPELLTFTNSSKIKLNIAGFTSFISLPDISVNCTVSLNYGRYSNINKNNAYSFSGTETDLALAKGIKLKNRYTNFIYENSTNLVKSISETPEYKDSFTFKILKHSTCIIINGDKTDINARYSIFSIRTPGDNGPSLSVRFEILRISSFKEHNSYLFFISFYTVIYPIVLILLSMFLWSPNIRILTRLHRHQQRRGNNKS